VVKITQVVRQKILLCMLIVLCVLSGCSSTHGITKKIFSELLVASKSKSELLAINTSSGQLVGTFNPGSRVNQILFSNNKLVAYLLLANKPVIEVINPYSLTIDGAIKLPGVPKFMAVSPQKNSIYGYVLIKHSPDLAVVNLANYKTVSSYYVGQDPSSVTILSSGLIALVTDYLNNSLNVVDLVRKEIKERIAVCQNPTNVSYRLDSLVAYVGCDGSDQIQPVNLIKFNAQPAILVNQGISQMLVDRLNLRDYIVKQGSNLVSVLNLINGSLETPITLNANTYCVAISSDDSRLFVSEENTKRVLILSTTFEKPVGYFQLGIDPGCLSSN
jgi:DNA-binding beta-propeller fold protein YncE